MRRRGEDLRILCLDSLGCRSTTNVRSSLTPEQRRAQHWHLGNEPKHSRAATQIGAACCTGLRGLIGRCVGATAASKQLRVWQDVLIPETLACCLLVARLAYLSIAVSNDDNSRVSTRRQTQQGCCRPISAEIRLACSCSRGRSCMLQFATHAGAG